MSKTDYMSQLYRGDSWALRCVENIKRDPLYRVSHLKGSHSGTAVVVGAGPSLDDHVAQLRESDVHLIVTSSAYPAFRHRANHIIHTDGKRPIWWDPACTRVAGTFWAQLDGWADVDKALHFVGSNKYVPVSGMLELPSFPSHEVGFSGVQLAAWLGYDVIVVVGCDYAPIGEALYAECTGRGDTSVKFGPAGIITEYPKSIRDEFNRPPRVPLPDVSALVRVPSWFQGKPIATTAGMASSLDHVAAYVGDIGAQIKWVSGGGARVPGLRAHTLDEALMGASSSGSVTYEEFAPSVRDDLYELIVKQAKGQIQAVEKLASITPASAKDGKIADQLKKVDTTYCRPETLANAFALQEFAQIAGLREISPGERMMRQMNALHRSAKKVLEHFDE